MEYMIKLYRDKNKTELKIIHKRLNDDAKEAYMNYINGFDNKSELYKKYFEAMEALEQFYFDTSVLSN